MSGGGYVPYTLRQNKAIDRHLFLELLQRLQKRLPIRKYRYVGFGGPFLEDMKLMHAHFGMTDLTSLEVDPRVLRRQQFNKPISCINLLGVKSSEFIDDDNFDKKTILWLDYAKPSQIRTQLEEVQRAAAKMAAGDVLKVTLNANMAAYLPQLEAQSAEQRVATLRMKLGVDYFPAECDETAFESVADFPAILLKAFGRAAKRGTGGSEYFFQPLAAYVYADGVHSMLTITGAVLEQDDAIRRQLLVDCEIANWEFAITEWGDDLVEPISIRIPDLSLRERLFLDAQLPVLRKNKRIRARALKYVGPALTSKPEDEEAALKQYGQFYRHFPYLSRIIV